MSLSLSGKYALVTGSTDGLGKKIAFTLAREGVNVIIHGRNEEKVAALLLDLKKEFSNLSLDSVVCDLEKSEDIEKTFSKITKLDILINNAGVWTQGDIVDTTPEKIISLTKINTLAPLLITRILLPILLKSEFGQVVNVVSKDGTEIPHGYFDTIYVATKWAIHGFTEALAKEFTNKNLRIMGYYPGGMETNIFKKAGDNLKDHEPWMFDAQESADAILFMLTRSEKITVKRMDLINQLEG